MAPGDPSEPGSPGNPVELVVAPDRPATGLPLALADHHRRLDTGQAALLPVTGSLAELPTDHRRRIWIGAGFTAPGPSADADSGAVRLVREHTLADTVGPGMKLLICGLNPSPASAQSGVGFARPGNRFWPAALAAGLVERDRDPRHALTAHGVGMTDLVKRTTRTAAELHRSEYQAGLKRLGALVDWLQPGAVCFVGLAGWRAAADRRAVAGLQPTHLSGRPVYLMPSTSGLNAHSRLSDLTDHLRAARSVATGTTERPGRPPFAP